MPVINLAQKYSDKIVERFYVDSVVLGKSSKKYTWDGVKSVNVYSIKTYDPVDYIRPQNAVGGSDPLVYPASMARYGSTHEVEDEIQTLTINMDKAVSLSVDKGNNTNQMLVKNAGTVMARELRERFVPMFDKYALARWCGKVNTTNAGSAPAWASYVQTKVETIGASHADATTATPEVNKIVDAISAGVTALRNKGTDIEDAYCYIGETNFAKLLLAPEFLNIDKLGARNLEKGVLGTVRGMKIVPVPDSYMKPDVVESAVVTEANNAYLGKTINFMIVKKQSVLAPTKIKDAKIHTDPVGISGALLEIRWMFDAFTLNTIAEGIYVSQTTADA